MTSWISLWLSVIEYIILWNATSALTIATTSLDTIAASNTLLAVFNSSICSGVTFLQASVAASSSNAERTSRTSLISFTVICATSAPFLGIIITRPSSSNFLIASRIGVRLTPSLLASCISISLSPGSISPVRIACLNVLNTTSLNGRYSFTSIFNSPFIV